ARAPKSFFNSIGQIRSVLDVRSRSRLRPPSGPVHVITAGRRSARSGRAQREVWRSLSDPVPEVRVRGAYGAGRTHCRLSRTPIVFPKDPGIEGNERP